MAAAAIVAYCVPLYDSVAPAVVNIRAVQRLHDEHKPSPDLQSDDVLRQLIPYVPRSGVVGLVLSAAYGSVDRQRLLYRLQYALAPRIVVAGAEPDFVVVYGPDEPLPPQEFVLVRHLQDLRLYRRVTR